MLSSPRLDVRSGVRSVAWPRRAGGAGAGRLGFGFGVSWGCRMPRGSVYCISYTFYLASLVFSRPGGPRVYGTHAKIENEYKECLNL